jgi:hypothetical protein
MAGDVDVVENVPASEREDVSTSICPLLACRYYQFICEVTRRHVFE